MAYKTMEGQAGDRPIVSYWEKSADGTYAVKKTTHYASVDDFWEYILTEKVDLLAYQIKGHEKIDVKVCSICNQYHTDGTSGNCGN